LISSPTLKPTIFLCLLLATVFRLHAEDEPPWTIDATGTNGFIEYPEGGVVVAGNGVTVTSHGVVLMANQVEADAESGEVKARGDVMILGRDHLWRGTNVLYNFKTGEIQSGTFKTENDPFFLAGEHLTGRTNQFYNATNVTITTDNYAKPAFKIRARRLVMYPGDHFEAHDAMLYVGNVPVFYFPYYRRSFGPHPNNFVFTPGYRGTFGPFLLGTYNWRANDQVDGALHLDLRERRGVGGGPDLNFHLGPKWGDGSARYYFTHDSEPNIDGITNTISPIPATLPHDRSRFAFAYKAEPVTNLTAKISMNYQSDPLILRDFFEREYRANVQPNSFAELNKVWPNYSLDAMVQPRLNDFWERVERLPDIKLTALRQQVGVTPIYYEGESSAGYFKRSFANTDPFNITNNYSAGRMDTFHQFVLPQTYFGWLNVTPRVGGRLTYYRSEDGYFAQTNDFTRGVFNTGAEASFKLSRVWTEPKSKLWDVNGLRHIIEPSINYVFVPSPTTPPSQLPQFDYEVPSLRLLPIDYPEYNAIDSIDSQNVLRLALRNKLQTKRENGVENLLNWALYTDWRLATRPDKTVTLQESTATSTNAVPHRIHQESFANVFSDVDLRPRSWLFINSQLRFDVENNRFNETFNQVTVQPNNVWSASVSYRYLINNDPGLVNPLVQQLQISDLIPIPSQELEIPGHKTVQASVHYRLNENWAARISGRFEGRDGTFEEQQYTIYRDLRSWTAALSFRLHQNQGAAHNDFTIALTFSLKALPRFGLGSDSEHPQLLLGNG